MAYGLVPQAIQQTGRTMRDILSHEAAGRVSMAQAGLLKERQDYDIREAEYEKYMQAPDTIENIVNTMNVPEEQKQSFRDHPLYEDLQDIPTSRTNFFQALQATMAKKKEWAREDETSKQEYHQGLLRTYTPESVQAYVGTITDENSRGNVGNVGLLKRPVEQVPYDKTKEGALALANIKARTGLTPSQQINLKQKTFAEKKDINEAFEVEYPKPLRPLKAKELPEYNKQMQSWSLAQTTNEYEKMKDYYTSVLGEKASEQINKKAMAAGKKLYMLSSKIENRDEKKVFLQELRNISPDLYEIHKAIDRKSLETKTEKPPDKPTEEPPKKMTEKELREALYKKTGDRSVLFSTHKPLEKAREAIGKAGRGIGKAGREALSFVNRPMTEEERKNLPRYSQGLR